VAGTGIVDVDPRSGFHAGPRHLLLFRHDAPGVRGQERPTWRAEMSRPTSFSIDTIRLIVDWHW